MAQKNVNAWCPDAFQTDISLQCLKSPKQGFGIFAVLIGEQRGWLGANGVVLLRVQ